MVKVVVPESRGSARTSRVAEVGEATGEQLLGCEGKLWAQGRAACLTWLSVVPEGEDHRFNFSKKKLVLLQKSETFVPGVNC